MAEYIEALKVKADAQAVPAAVVFPLMGNDEMEALSQDILANGLREPIWRDPEGWIIDGRNRWVACQLVGVECRHHTRDLDGRELVDFVISQNLHRRHLDTSQRAMIAAKLAQLPEGRPPKSRQIAPDQPAAMTQAQAAQMLNVHERTLRNAKAVLREADDETVRKVERGQMSINAALATARGKPRTPPKAVASPQRPRRPMEPANVIPEPVVRLQMWLRNGSRLLAEFGSGTGALEGCARCGVQLDPTDFADVQSFVADLASAAKAVRAA